MAMSASSMAGKMVSELQGKDLAAEDTALLTKWATAIATAIVGEITSNAQVNVPGTGLAAPNGAVTGQASGKIQ